MLGLLRKVRRELNELWQRTESANAAAGDDPKIARTRVIFYFGQNVEESEAASAGEGK